MAKQHASDGKVPRPNLTPSFYCLWLAVLVLWGLFLLWTWYPPRPELVEEFYTRGVYRAVLTLLTTFTVRTTQSLALWVVVCGPVIFLLAWILRWTYLRRTGKGSHWRGLFWGFKWAFILAPVVLWWFLVFWGAGYQRLPLEKRLGLDTAKMTEVEAGQLRGQLLAIIHADIQPAEKRDVARAVAAISKAMSSLVTVWDDMPIVLPKLVKATPKGLLMINGTSGMCAPLTLEAHVDGALPEAAFVSVAAHELSHIAGICGEAEANFMGYAAGLNADDPFARYAVALGMYRSLAAQLPQEQRKAAFEALPPLALDDTRREREAHQKYRIHWFEKASWAVYNKYLTSRGVTEGVRDYGRGMTLFAAARRKGLVQVPAAFPAPIPAEALPRLEPVSAPPMPESAPPMDAAPVPAPEAPPLETPQAVPAA